MEFNHSGVYKVKTNMKLVNKTNENMEKKALYSERLKAKDRNYFLDLRTSSKGTNYITLTQSKKNEEASRLISTGQLHAFLHFHLQPINVLVLDESSEHKC